MTPAPQQPTGSQYYCGFKQGICDIASSSPTALPNPTCPGCNQIDVADRVLWLQEHDAAIRAEAARKAREDDCVKIDVQLKTLRQNIKKKEFKPYMNHDGKAVWYKDVEELIEALRSTQHPGQEG